MLQSRSIAMAVFALFFTGCSKETPTPENIQVVNEYRPRLEARLALYSELAGRMAQGDGSAGELKLGNMVKLDFPARIGQKFGGNAINLSVETAQTKTASPPSIWKTSVHVSSIRQSLDRQNLPYEPDRYRKDFEKFLSFKYLALLRTSAYTPPKETGPDTFSPGSIDWEVYVFNIKDKKLLGKISGTTTSGYKAYTRGSAGRLDRGWSLEDGFGSLVASKIGEAMQPYCKEGQSPQSW